MKILIMGLPGAGKTTLATHLVAKLSAVHFNADETRQHINKDLGFTVADRIEQATRLGFLCDVVNRLGCIAIADFICPTEETRRAFNPSFTIWVNRISAGRYPDTNAIFQSPLDADIIINNNLSISEELELVICKLSANQYNKEY